MHITKKRILILFAILFLVIPIFVQPVSAKLSGSDLTALNGITTEAALDEFVAEHFNGFEEFIYGWASKSQVKVGKVMQNNKFLFDTDWVGDVLTGELLKAVRDSILVIGRMFCLLYFLLSLVDSASRDSFTVEVLVKSLAKLAIIYIIFDPNTIDKIVNFANAIEDWLLENMSGLVDDETAQTEIAKGLVAEIGTANFIGQIGIWLKYGLSSTTRIFSLITICCVAFGRVIELAVYQTMLPLGMASIYNGGMHSPGFRYIKKILALYVQGAVMFVTLYASLALQSSSANINVLMGSFINLKDIVIDITAAMIIAKSKSIANDVMGA